MRKTVFVLALCIFRGPISVKAQVNQETDSLYIAALSYYLISCDSNHQKFPNIYPQIDTIFLQQTDEIEHVPAVIEGRAMVVLTNENFRKVYKRHQNKLLLTRVFPIEVNGPEIKIAIIPYHSAWAKRKLNLALSDWTDVYFKYDCNKKRWLFSRVVTDGI